MLTIPTQALYRKYAAIGVSILTIGAMLGLGISSAFDKSGQDTATSQPPSQQVSLREQSNGADPNAEREAAVRAETSASGQTAASDSEIGEPPAAGESRDASASTAAQDTQSSQAAQTSTSAQPVAQPQQSKPKADAQSATQPSQSSDQRADNCSNLLGAVPTCGQVLGLRL